MVFEPPSRSWVEVAGQRIAQMCATLSVVAVRPKYAFEAGGIWAISFPGYIIL